MAHPHEDQLPEDLTAIDELLRRQRPHAEALQLDRMRAATSERINRRPRSSTVPKGTPLKSRIAITAILAMGVLMSGTGATLALTGPSSSGSAARAQYCPPASQNGQGGQNSNSQNTNGRRCGQQNQVRGVSDQSSDTLGGGAGGGNDSGGDPTAAQANRQAAAGNGDDLPFTGFAALPIVLAGICLLATGLLLNRRASGSSAV
jgi:hypothetical protein